MRRNYSSSQHINQHEAFYSLPIMLESIISLITIKIIAECYQKMGFILSLVIIILYSNRYIIVLSIIRDWYNFSYNFHSLDNILGKNFSPSARNFFQNIV